MSTLTDTAAAASMARFERSAAEIAKAGMAGSDLPAAIVRETTNSLAAKADIAVLKTADKTMGTLLDVMT